MGMMILKSKYHIVAIIKIAMYRILFGKKFQVGGGTTFRRFFNIYLENGAYIKIGKNCFFNHGCSVNALKGVKIGDECIFGENVKIYDHNHQFVDAKTRIKDQGYATSVVTIGNRCWFGSNVIILKGVNIGNNCVIGAGSIINRDIPDDSIVMSNRDIDIKKIIRKEVG